MAKAHILDRIGDSGIDYNAVAHFAMPVGNNSVSVPWKTCYLASFGAKTPTSLIAVVGNGAGQITQNELNQITSGDLIEIRFTYSDYPESVTLAQKNAVIDDLAQRAINEFQLAFSGRFAYYGYTRP